MTHKPLYVQLYESGQHDGLERARVLSNYTACLIAHTNAIVARDSCRDNQRYYYMGYVQSLSSWLKDYEHRLTVSIRGW